MLEVSTAVAKECSLFSGISLIVFASKTPDHVSQGEDDTKDQLGIIGLRSLRISADSFGVSVGRRCHWGLSPASLVDTFGWQPMVSQCFGEIAGMGNF